MLAVTNRKRYRVLPGVSNYDKPLQNVTECNKVFQGLQGVSRCYMVLHGVTWCFKVLHGVTWCYMVFQGVTWCYMVFPGRHSLVMSHWMCRWMGSHFHDLTDYNGIVFSSIFNTVTRMGLHVFGTLTIRKSFAQK